MNEKPSSARKLLTEYMKIKENIAKRELQREELQGRLTGGAIRYDKDKIMSSPGNVNESWMCEVADLDREIKQLYHERNIYERQIRRYAKRVKDEDGRAIIRMRYLQGFSWEKIPDILLMSRASMFRRYDIALAEMDRMIRRDDDRNRQKLIDSVKARQNVC